MVYKDHAMVLLEGGAAMTDAERLRLKRLSRLAIALEQFGLKPSRQAVMVGVNPTDYRRSLKRERGISEGTLLKLEAILIERVFALFTYLEVLATEAGGDPAIVRAVAPPAKKLANALAPLAESAETDFWLKSDEPTDEELAEELQTTFTEDLQRYRSPLIRGLAPGFLGAPQVDIEGSLTNIRPLLECDELCEWVMRQAIHKAAQKHAEARNQAHNWRGIASLAHRMEKMGEQVIALVREGDDETNQQKE